jgi:hypothetical protein
VAVAATVDETVDPATGFVTLAAGATVSMRHVAAAGVPSVLPARSVARTSKVCTPSASGGKVVGLRQGSNAPPSSRHAKVLPPSEEENENVGAGLLVDPGCDAVIEVFGGAVSKVKVRDAAVVTLPAASIAHALRTYDPFAGKDAAENGNDQVPPATTAGVNVSVVLANELPSQ